MNTQLRRTFYLFAAGFVALVGVMAYWQVYAREDLTNHPSNGLQSQRSQETPRGLIFAGDGETVLARSERAGGNEYERIYPEGEVFANVVGYWSNRFGASGIEIGQNNNLSGTGEPETLDELLNQFSGGPETGNNVTLTVDPELQREAYNQLAQSNTGRGAVAAFDPQTGETLALATYPSYDPNVVIDEGFEEISNEPNNPLLNRATQVTYPPGSTFKVITAAAALEAGVRPTDRFNDDGTYETPGYSFGNYRGKAYGNVTFAEALVFSINTVFAQIAVDRVGPEKLAAMAREFGFGYEYEDYPLYVAPSDLGLPPEEWAEGNTAPISFGQDRVVSNVFEMGLVASAIANDGDMMQPRLVREVRSSDGIILDRPTPRPLNEALPEGTARTLNEMMQGVVEEGELVAAQIQGTKVAGKTGTAENPQGEPHSWFISFAPADDPEIAVAVVVENGGVIGEDGAAETPALTIAGNLMRAYLDRPAPAPPSTQPNLPAGVPGGGPGEVLDPAQRPAQPSAPDQPGAPVDPFAPFRNAAPQQQQQSQPGQPPASQQQPLQPVPRPQDEGPG
ncbi:MAG: cell division protein FtsI [Actinobacteria bacterium]|nr:penicillin-binding protein 2 [Actinomycetota bacterium]PLS85920.1 MAG: cell division protein FtsI [Actinomycetota bacterium]